MVTSWLKLLYIITEYQKINIQLQSKLTGSYDYYFTSEKRMEGNEGKHFVWKKKSQALWYFFPS